MDAAAALALDDCARGGSGLDVIEFGGKRAYFKRSKLRGSSRWRWGARVALLRDRVPRVREYYNLCWLTERLFLTPLPIAAGGFARAGLPAWQFLLTEAIAPAETLESFVVREDDEGERAAVLDELAREVARMHALGFVHRDLYPRNVLVLPRGALQRVAFLDAWAGGPPPQMRGASFDLGCLFLRVDGERARDERERFLARYAHERAALGRAVDLKGLVRGAQRTRERAIARLTARPHELRGLALPDREW